MPTCGGLFLWACATGNRPQGHIQRDIPFGLGTPWDPQEEAEDVAEEKDMLLIWVQVVVAKMDVWAPETNS